jgi:hypothetical protein
LKNNVVPKKSELGDIFSLFGEEYRRKHKLPLQQRKVMFAVEACRTSVLGGHVDSCNSCGHKRISYNSCRNRHCPKCQNLNKEKWIEKLSCNLLPVKYFHIVFTIPSELNRLCLVNQKVLYDILFQSASQTILSLAKDEKHLGVLSGLVAVLHTWGQNLMDHPHLHTMVPAGGWSEWNGYWKNTKKNFFIHVKVLSKVFRGKFLAAIKTAYKNKQLKFEGEIKSLNQSGNFKNLIDILYKKDWVVYAKEPFKNASGIIKYLGNYTHRIAISNDRIQKIEGDEILFGWKDYRDNSKRKMMSLTAHEFIRRFLLHVLPPGFCKIRYYGILSSRNRNTVLQKCKNAMAIKEAKSKFEGLMWNEVLKIVTGFDVLMCPHCKKGKMIPVGTFLSRRAPP